MAELQWYATGPGSDTLMLQLFGNLVLLWQPRSGRRVRGLGPSRTGTVSSFSPC
jgi:hypothetical protein